MTSALFSWVSREDLAALDDPDPDELGPTRRAVQDLPLDRVVLLWNPGMGPQETLDRYCGWLRGSGTCEVEGRQVELEDPSSHSGILRAATNVVEAHVHQYPEDAITFLLSSGTPAMHACWILLSKARFRAGLVKTSIQKGTEQVDVPFDIALDRASEWGLDPDAGMARLVQALPPESPDFERIQGESMAMRRAKVVARQLAPRDVPVLILGDSGTGKELFARAIHGSSQASDGPFVAVNCGAIPAELVDSTLFGHRKGSFTGADRDHAGVFEDADGGTLFLDEIGDLPPNAQVRLLRTLQEGEVVRVGETTPRKVGVRVIAATHVDLFAAVGRGGFRRDLAYRLAVGILRLPPLQDRGGDFEALVRQLHEEIDEESRDQPGFEPRQMDPGALTALRAHPWPGNVRELRSTLVRAILFSTGASITRQDVQEALLPTMDRVEGESILGRPLGDGLDVRDLERKVRKHYVERAMREAGGVKAAAARLLGLTPQTFQHWAPG